jgi:hypothetical protein
VLIVSKVVIPTLDVENRISTPDVSLNGRDWIDRGKGSFDEVLRNVSPRSSTVLSFGEFRGGRYDRESPSIL